jgi:hypothetical protein
MAESSGPTAESDAVERKIEKKLKKRERRLAEAAEQGNGAQAAPGPPIAFVHIPKTAGGTLKSMFSAAYGREAITSAGNYLRSPDKTAVAATRFRPGTRVTIGHTPYGLFRRFLPSGTRYITFLREPVDRVMSHYYRHLQAKAGTLEEALELGLPDLSNLSTRFLCADATLDALPDGALDEAKANLESFAFVGFQERFDESVVLLQEALGIGRIPYGVNAHVNANRPSVEEATDEQRALIAAHNQLDVELYAWARSRFDAAAAARDDLTALAETLHTDSESTAEDQQRRIGLALEFLNEALPPGSERPFEELVAEAAETGLRLGKPELKRAKRQIRGCRVVKGDDGSVVWVRKEKSGQKRAAQAGVSDESA